jgi:hypothetical protein
VTGCDSHPPKIQAWLQEQATRELEREFPRQEQVPANLRGVLDASRREEDALLTLRLRDLLSDDAFVARRRQIHERRGSVQHQIEASERGPVDIVADARAGLEFARRARAAFLQTRRFKDG